MRFSENFCRSSHSGCEFISKIQRVFIPMWFKTFGVFGMKHWLETRISFSPASIPTWQQIIPFCIVALDSTNAISEELSSFYLIEQLDQYYNGLLNQSAEWAEWKMLINQLTKLGMATYNSQHNLHKNQDEIKQFTILYSKLKQEVLKSAVI